MVKNIFIIFVLFCMAMAAPSVHALIYIQNVSNDALNAGYESDLEDYINAVGSRDNVISAPVPMSVKTPNQILESCQLHIQEETAKLKGDYYESDSAWLQHVVKCKKCCAPLMMTLWRKYNRTVAKLKPLVIFFDHGSSTIRPEYLGQLRQFYANNWNKHIFLVGRASQTGTAGYNLELSGRRASNVKRFFTDGGVDSSLIEFSFFGEKPPRLNSVVINLYGINESDFQKVIAQGLTDKERQLHKMNQSVVVIAYEKNK